MPPEFSPRATSGVDGDVLCTHYDIILFAHMSNNVPRVLRN